MQLCEHSQSSCVFLFCFFKLTPLAKVTCDLTVSPGLYPVLINKLMDKNSWKH